MTTKTPIREAAEELNHLGIINGDDIALAAKTIQRVLSERVLAEIVTLRR